jgi:hypothetical protein
MLKTVRGVNALSLGKMAGIIYACIGLFAGTLIAVISVLGGFAGLLSQQSGGRQFVSMFFGVGAVVFLPIFYGILGAILGTIVGAIFNVAARMVGGIEFEID